MSIVADLDYQTNTMKCKFLLYKYNTNIVVACGVAIMDRYYDLVKITSGEVNNEIFNSSNIDYYTCLLYDFDTTLLKENFINRSLKVTINKCKISSNFSIYLNSDESYWDCEIIPLLDYNTGEAIYTLIVRGWVLWKILKKHLQ